MIHNTACINMIDRLEPASVDTIFTDPPYPREFLHCYDELAALAVHALRPGGLVLAMSGQFHMHDLLRRMDVDGLEYRWMLAYVYERPRAMIHAAKVSVGWKPILVYQRSGGGQSEFYSEDTFRIPPRKGKDKANHVWGQNLHGVYAVAKEWLRPGWRVCDPFVGAGSLLLAAKRTGCEVVGCDTNPHHVESARDLLRDDLIDQTEHNL